MSEPPAHGPPSEDEAPEEDTPPEPILPRTLGLFSLLLWVSGIALTLFAGFWQGLDFAKAVLNNAVEQ